MARIYTVVVPKGGCGKTTTAQNLGMEFARQGERVLFVDDDPQANLSSVLGYRHRKGQPTLYSALKQFAESFEARLPVYKMPSGVWLIPASMALNKANDELANVPRREFVLQRLLEPIFKRFDRIVIDTLPYLGVLVNNALAVTDESQEIIVPVHAEPLGIASAGMLLQHLQDMYKARLIDDLLISGGLITMVDKRTQLNTQMAALARSELGLYMNFFTTQIDRSIQFPESQFYRQPISLYSPRGKGTTAYQALTQEIIEGKHLVAVKDIHVPANFADSLLQAAEEQVGEDMPQMTLEEFDVA